MKKFLINGVIGLFCLFSQSYLFAQITSDYNKLYGEDQTEIYHRLYSAVQNSGSPLNIYPDLNDFNSRAQQGLDFMSPGATIQNLHCKKITDWSPYLEMNFRKYLLDLYNEHTENMELSTVEMIVNHWKTQKSKIGIMFWEINYNNKSQLLSSITVFDNKWNILFDTKLISFISDIRYDENAESGLEEEILFTNGSLPIENERSGNAQLDLIVYGTLPGSQVTMHWKVRGTAIISPYITAATNDAFYHFFTPTIHNWRSDESTFPPPPPGDPCSWFGLYGEYANLYQNAEPWKNPIIISEGSDHFNSGIYNVSGANGRLWSFQFSFSVSYSGVGLGITPQQNTPDFVLIPVNSGRVDFGNYTYWHASTNSYRAFFYDDGYLSLDDFYMLTGSGGEEVGTITMNLRLRAAYTFAGILHMDTGNWEPLELNVEYLRGDALAQPSFEVTSSSYSVALGQIDTIKTTIINNSNYINLEGGDVSIDVASLNDNLVLLSPATLPVETIEEASSKEFLFVVQGNTAGIVTPQVNITNLGWEAPVPPEVIINTIASIDSNIVVGNPSEVENETNKALTYSLYKNYPNPFNPSTTIKYDLPEANFVSLKVYDVLGREVSSIVNEQKQAGRYEINFNASSLSSGTYLYRIKAGDFVETKKMMLLK